MSIIQCNNKLMFSLMIFILVSSINADNPFYSHQSQTDKVKNINDALLENNFNDLTNKADYNIKFFQQNHGITPVFIDDNSEYSFKDQQERFNQVQNRVNNETKNNQQSAQRNKEREDLIKNNPQLFNRARYAINSNSSSKFDGDEKFEKRVKESYEYAKSIADENIKSAEVNGQITYITGDEKLACHAVMCMSSSGGTQDTIDECTEAILKYESIIRHTIPETIIARKKWLNKCPNKSDNGKIVDLH